ncbi:pilus assembly protein N-terminal domain-containing protein [Phreatobacter sp. HK31-P]
MNTMIRRTGPFDTRSRIGVTVAALCLALVAGGRASATETPLAGAASPDLAAVVAQGMTVTMDQARVMRLPAHVSTLVIGNPLIADATVQRGGLMVLTGKSVGSTNLIALDGRGEQLLTIQIRVRPQNDAVVQVYRGVDRETYSCSPTCERTIAVGDSKAFFDTALGNSRSRDGAASGITPR